MASEITITASLAISKGGVSVSGQGTKASDLSGTNMQTSVQIIGFSAGEAITLVDFASAGPLFFKNLDASNFVTIALDEAMTQVVCKILAGEPAVFRPGTTTLYAKADTGDVQLQIVGSEA